ncbi:MAG TPA: lytic transglycosylase domain-containing protein, partial [Candidatus Baltobacteraceae bacterium]|nr:lytic transglycosylase domain-containing protein [Candidatus Baltobacteraceae bacterium]
LLYGVALQSFNSGIDGREAVVWAEATIAEADRERLDARLLVALIAVESAWRSDAVSSAGAVGLAQLMPQTAAGLGVDAADPLENIHGAAVHLRGLLARYAGRPGNEQYVDALAAYNAGAGAVDRYGGVPPYAETREYVRRVMALWARLAGTRAKAAGWAEPEPVGSRGRRPLAPFRR